MGFIFDSTAVPEEMITNLLSAFERLPQRVIFKYDIQEDDNAYGNRPKLSVPQNVLVLPWVPQQAILAHPATKVFITHCGMHGVLEAIYHQASSVLKLRQKLIDSCQVPMVGMPVFIDQKDVLKRMEEKGVGLGVPKGAPADEIHAAIVEVSGTETRTKPVKKSQQTFVCSINLKIQPCLLARTGNIGQRKAAFAAF